MKPSFLALGLLLAVSCDSSSRRSPSASAPHHAWVQFAAVPDEETLGRLAASGTPITGLAIGQTYEVFLGTGQAPEEAGSRCLGAIPPSAKVPDLLLQGQFNPGTVDAQGRARLRVSFHSDVPGAAALETIRRAGGEVSGETEFKDLGTISILIDPSGIGALAAEDAVRRIREIELPRISMNAGAATQAGIPALRSGPYGLGGAGLSGAGFTVGIWEEAGYRIFPHNEFASRLSYAPDVAGALPYAEHGTHVAGTIGATGLNPEARGMASLVAMVNHDWETPAVEFLTGGRAGWTAGNNSWGWGLGWRWDGVRWVNNGYSEYFGAYDQDSSLMDDAIWQAEREGKPVLICFAAGNDRSDGRTPALHDGVQHADPSILNPYYDTIASSATMKNVVTVGAVDEAGVIAPFSSIGPVDDGRIKPDIVAKGVDVLSTIPTGYEAWPGTSMATPVVTGASVLITEQFQATFGRRPSIAELKGLLLHTATDLGRPGPDYVYGWGLLNARAAADLIRTDAGKAVHIVRDSVANATHDAFHFRASAGTGPLRLTLTWIDPPGYPDAPSYDVVNHLDLRLLSPGGVVHYPYKLDRANPVAVATTAGANLPDTVEQVFIAAPEPGIWRVDVAGTLLQLGPLQGYGLVSSHALAPGWLVEELQELELDVDGAGNAVLSWPAVSDPALVEFQVFRSVTRGQSWQRIATLPPASTSHVDTTAPPGAPMVMYDVRAVLNIGGEQAFDALPGARRTDAPRILEPAEGAALPFTTAATPVTGLAEPLSTVTLYDNGAQIGQVSAAADGSFTFSGHIFAVGSHVLTAVAKAANEWASLPSLERRFSVN